MNKTFIIYKALRNTMITLASGHKQRVKSGELIVYNTANKEQFTLSEQERDEQFTFVHNEQYMRRTLA